MTVKERYEGVIAWFLKNMPEPRTELQYDTPFHLLLAVILSAQCTDKRVNIVTPPLFEAYPTPYELAAASEEQVYEYIRSVTFPNNKTRSLLKAARMLVDDFGGEVPSDLDSLMKLPGVGRKTANLVAGDIYGRPAVVADTHCIRISNRLGLCDTKDPYKVELQLKKLLPPEESNSFCHRLVLFGRDVCSARSPRCAVCPLQEVCPSCEAITPPPAAGGEAAPSPKKKAASGKPAAPQD